MKLFKDVSFWCIILTILIVMIIHNMLTSDKIIEGQDNMEEGNNEENNDRENNNEVISMMNGQPQVEAVIELSLGRNRGKGLTGIQGSTVGSTVGATVGSTVETIDTIDIIRNELREKQITATGLSNDATDEEIDEELNNIMQTLEEPNSQGNIDHGLLMVIQEIASLKEQITQLNLQNEQQDDTVDEITVDEITDDETLDTDVNTFSKTPNPESNLKDDGTWYIPIDGIEGEGRTSSSWEECQQRCLDTEGCVYFNAFSNGGCHITDGREGTSDGEYRQDIIDLDQNVAGTNTIIKSGRAEELHTGACVPVNTGISDRVKGAFNASCNKNDEENDYCRFIGSETGPYGIWLSCVSPDNNCREDPLHNSRYGWSIDELPENVKDVFTNESEEIQRTIALKNFFKEQCGLSEKCPGSNGLPNSPDPFSPGVAGHPNRARGFFDASCNGEENDYCRFVGSGSNSNGIWLSCLSPSNENGCLNKYPGPNEKLGWNLEDIDENSKVVSTDPSALEAANVSLRSFFERRCRSPSCVGGLMPSGGCNTLNENQESKRLCGEGMVYENINNNYKQCYLDGDVCIPSDEVCIP